MGDDYTAIKYDKNVNSAVITLNVPKRRNALTMAMVSELAEALNRGAQDPEVRSVVITGAGTAFCAGRDFKESLDSTPAERDRFMTALYGRLTDITLGLEKPLISAINGACMGGGCGIAFMADIVLMAEDATLAWTEVDRGLVPAFNALYLPRLIGRIKASYLLFTCEVISAAEAYRLGLISHVVPRADWERTISGLTQRLAAKPPLPIKLLRKLMYRMLDMEYRKGVETALDVYGLVDRYEVSYEDSKERISAFLEKRAPK